MAGRYLMLHRCRGIIDLYTFACLGSRYHIIAFDHVDVSIYYPVQIHAGTDLISIEHSDPEQLRIVLSRTIGICYQDRLKIMREIAWITLCVRLQIDLLLHHSDDGQDTVLPVVSVE